MADLQVTLETVTPLFLAGADPRGAPELRAASVRGALRFWLRALLGGVIGDAPDRLDELRKAESAVFGSTDTGASAVIVRVTGEEQAQPFRPLPHSQSKTFTAQGIAPSKALTITLAPRPPHRHIPEAALGPLVMFILLGGMGKRSRRGFGSVVIRSVGEGFPLQPSAYTTADAFSVRVSPLIKDAISKTKSLVLALGLSVGTPSRLAHFPILDEQYAKILFCKTPFEGWEEGMKEFWKVLRSDSYRDNPVFGFAVGAARQASPLHLRIVKLAESYHILLTAFRVHFAGQQPSWEVMQQLLEECQQKWNGEWVVGGGMKWQ